VEEGRQGCASLATPPLDAWHLLSCGLSGHVLAPGCASPPSAVSGWSADNGSCLCLAACAQGCGQQPDCWVPAEELEGPACGDDSVMRGLGLHLHLLALYVAGCCKEQGGPLLWLSHGSSHLNGLTC
jgi:hypothetical protein